MEQMQEARRRAKKFLARDVVLHVFIRAGTLRDVSRALRTCKAWVNVSKARYFWLKVVRRDERVPLEKVMIRVSLEDRFGVDGRWETFSFIVNDGFSMAMFMQNVRQRVAPEHFMTRLTRYSVFFDRSVISQASLGGVVHVRSPMRDTLSVRFASSIRLEGRGLCEMGNPFEKFVDARDDVQIAVRICENPEWCVWSDEAVQRISVLEVDVRGSVHFFSKWANLGAARIQEISTTKGGCLNDEFLMLASRACTEGVSFMPLLRKAGWVEIPFRGVSSMWRVVAEVVCEIFPQMEEMRVMLTIDSPFDVDGVKLREWHHLVHTFEYDFEEQAKINRWEDDGQKLNLLEFAVLWDNPMEEVRHDFEDQLNIFAKHLSKNVVVSVLY